MSLSEAIVSVHPGDPIFDPTASPSNFVTPGRVPGIHVLPVIHAQDVDAQELVYRVPFLFSLRKSGEPDWRCQARP